MLRGHRRGAPRRRREHQLRVLRGVPRVRALGDHAGRRRGEAQGRPPTSPTSARGWTRSRPGVPFYVMKSNGGVLSAAEVVHQPITTMLSGPAAGALGAALIARHRRLRPGAHLRRRRHLDRRHGGHRRRADADHRGLGRRLPVEDPDDRRRHRRRRRRLDRLALPRGHAQGRPAVGRRRPRPDVLPATAATEPTVTDAHVVLGRIPPHLLGGEIPLSIEARPRRARRSSARSSTCPWSAPPPASSRSRRGTRPTRCAR